MSPTVVWTIFTVLCVLTAAGFIWFGIYLVRYEKGKKVRQDVLQQRYDQAYAEMRQRYGWEAEPAMAPPLRALFPFAVHKEASAVFTGQWRGRSFGVFEFKTVTEGASNEVSAAFGEGGRTTYSMPHWAAVVTIPVSLPEMKLHPGSSVRPEKRTLFDRVFTPPPPLGDEAFDRRFIVVAKDRSAIPAVFTPRVRQFVLADPRILKSNADPNIPNSNLGFWESNIYTETVDRFTPETVDQIVPKLDLLCDLLDRLYPIEQHAAPPGDA